MTNTPQWTPGPWEARPRDNRGWRSIVADGATIAEVFAFGRNMVEGSNVGDANARLIAAAPELVEVVTRLADNLIDDARNSDSPWYREGEEGYEMIRAASALLARIHGAA
jgi:hypothetical protein